MDCRSVFVYGYYGQRNLGDDLLAFAIAERALALDNVDQIYFRCHEDIPTLKHSPRAIQTRLESMLYDKQSLVKKIVALMAYLRANSKIIRRCHTFIIGGGTLISKDMSLTSLSILAMLVLVARVHGVRIIGMGLGMTRIDGMFRRMLARFILGSASRVALRDQRSFDSAIGLAREANLRLSADLAFSSAVAERFQGRLREGVVSKAIGVTVSAAILKSGKYSVQSKRLLSNLRECISNWSDAGYQVKLIGFQNLSLVGNVSFSDPDIFQSLELNMAGVEIIDASAMGLEVGAIYDDLDVMVGMRFHGLVLAALSSIPFVGFSVDHKVSELCRVYGMPCAENLDCSADWIMNSVQSALSRKVDEKVTRELGRLAEANFPDGLALTSAV